MRTTLSGLKPARALLTFAVDDAPVLAVNLAARLEPHVIRRHIPYGEGERRALDVYQPVAKGVGRPAVLFVHGGGWTSGAKEMYRFVGAALASRGAVVVIPNYTLYPQGRFPAFLEDVAHAFRWMRENAESFGADPARLFLAGHSAGAHIAAMVALDPAWLGGVGLSRADVAGAACLAGLYNFEIAGVWREVFDGIFDKSITQPLAHVARDAPPLFLATGDTDKSVSPQNTRDLAEAMRAIGGRVETVFYPRLGHREIIGAFSPLLRFLAPVADDVAAFVSTTAARADNTAR